MQVPTALGQESLGQIRMQSLDFEPVAEFSIRSVNYEKAIPMRLGARERSTRALI
jgi:hypothetical protein